MKKKIDINARFEELMKRDPLVQEAIQQYNKYKSIHPDVNQNGVHHLPPALQVLFNKISDKWNYAALSGFDDIDNLTVQKGGVTPVVREHTPATEYLGKSIVRKNVFVKEPGHLYLDINLTTLNIKKHNKYLKERCWEIAKKHLKKRDNEKTSIKEKRQPQPTNEVPEIAFVYHIKQDIFEKYLKWYDYHFQAHKGLPFRTIAAYEVIEKKYPDRLEEGKRKIAERIKKVNTWKGERVLKGVVGEEIKGEDAVEKAVKAIYEVIHRKHYPSKSRQELFSCPQHGQDCPLSCNNLKGWMKDFNRRNWKTTSPTSDINIDDIVDPVGIPKPAKSNHYINEK